MHARHSAFIYSTAILVGGGFCGADTITLRSSVRLNSGASIVTLADIADLDGPAAAALAGVPIADSSALKSVTELSINQVRSKLEEAGIHWGQINLNGRSVVLRPAATGASSPPLAMAPVALSADKPTTPVPPQRDTALAVDLAKARTLRGTIANLIVTQLHIDAGKVQLSFEHGDAEWLDAPAASTQFEVQPLSSAMSDRIDLAVRRWGEGKVAGHRTISVRPMLRASMALVVRDVSKDQVLADADLNECEEWLSPSQYSQAINRVAAMGRTATKSLKAGETLREKHVRREALVKRGDQVMVRCLVGGAVITLQAEARAEGGEGDTIEFRKPGERETFSATVTARGEAVRRLGGHSSKGSS